MNIAGWSSSVARRAHNPKVVGSNPAPATNLGRFIERWIVFFLLFVRKDGKAFAGWVICPYREKNIFG